MFLCLFLLPAVVTTAFMQGEPPATLQPQLSLLGRISRHLSLNGLGDPAALRFARISGTNLDDTPFTPTSRPHTAVEQFLGVSHPIASRALMGHIQANRSLLRLQAHIAEHPALSFSGLPVPCTYGAAQRCRTPDQLLTCCAVSWRHLPDCATGPPAMVVPGTMWALAVQVCAIAGLHLPTHAWLHPGRHALA